MFKYNVNASNEPDSSNIRQRGHMYFVYSHTYMLKGSTQLKLDYFFSSLPTSSLRWVDYTRYVFFLLLNFHVILWINMSEWLSLSINVNLELFGIEKDQINSPLKEKWKHWAWISIWCLLIAIDRSEIWSIILNAKFVANIFTKKANH